MSGKGGGSIDVFDVSRLRFVVQVNVRHAAATGEVWGVVSVRREDEANIQKKIS